MNQIWNRNRARTAGYDAFISYSHQWDRTLARAFQAQAQTLDRPWYRPRSLKIFRDETNLGATPHLWAEIENGLAGSRWLVLMACPAAAASPWVRREIRWWLENRSAKTILIAWTDGTLAWDRERRTFNWAATDALPGEELDGVFAEEPRWVDLRWLRWPEQISQADPRLLECVAEFVAPLTGKSKDELIGDHVRRHRTTVRWVRAVIAVLTLLLLLATTGGVVAYTQRNAARAQTLLAQSRQLVAEAVSITDTQPDLARQLLAQAYRMAPTAEAMGALINSYAIPRVIHAQGQAKAAVFSSRGVLAVVDDGVRLFDPVTLRQLAALNLPPRTATAAAFSPEGDLLAIGDSGGRIRIFDVVGERPRLLSTVHPAGEQTRFVQFTPRQELIVATEQGSAVLDIRAPAAPRPLAALPAGIVGVSPTGQLVVTREGHNVLRLWTSSGSGRFSPAATVTTPEEGWSDGRQYVAVSSNGQTLAFAGSDARTRIWDVTDPAHPILRPDLNQSGLSVDSVAFSPNEVTLATGAWDGVVGLWDISDPVRPRSGASLTGHTGSVDSLSFSSDGHTLASVGSDGAASEVNGSGPKNSTIRLWPVSGHERSSASVSLRVTGGFPPSFSPDGRLLATDWPAAIWRIDTDGAAPRKLSIVPGFQRSGQMAAFGPTGSLLVSGMPVVLWDVTDPARPRSLTAPATKVDSVEAIAFHPKHPLLATGGLSDEVMLWDISDPARPTHVSTLPGSRVESQALTFNSDGTLLATLDKDGGVMLWHVVQGTPPKPGERITINGARARSLAFRPHGRTLLVGDDKGAISTWEIPNHGGPTRLAASARHTGAIKGLAYHPGGTLAASGAEDGTIRLWNLADPTRPVELTALSGGGLYASATVAFSPDGHRMVAGSSHGVQVWNVDADEILRRLCTESPRITPTEWQQYLPDLDYDPPCA
ncbi:toll/interleukin-1 receptor domain-containing protein [Streptomyces sp. NPDC048330]|uniref:toll/interleukin-1 receptor domain-containing protein n=1 Tax=Streptomyces sp. NPDC048330 TaxID=3365533 RepID=UPI00371413BB